MEVIFTLLAQRQLEKLHDDITADANEERADGYITRIVDFCEGFSTFPHRGTRRDDVWTGLRVTGFERRVTIAFIVTEDAVLIEAAALGKTSPVLLVRTSPCRSQDCARRLARGVFGHSASA